MRHSSILLGLLVLSALPTTGRSQSLEVPPPPPSGFKPNVQAPDNLPAKLNLPPDTRIDVKVYAKNPRTETPDPNSPRLIWDPDLESAVIEKNQRDVHAVFQWEGGRSSEAFVINGIGFRTLSLAYPDTIAMAEPIVSFWVNKQTRGGGTGGDFPGILWYSPATFAGMATLNGAPVLVFAPGDKSALTAYPDGDSICLDATTLLPVWMSGGKSIFTFAYTPDTDVKIDPQGAFLKAVQNKFGHWP